MLALQRNHVPAVFVNCVNREFDANNAKQFLHHMARCSFTFIDQTAHTHPGNKTIKDSKGKRPNVLLSMKLIFVLYDLNCCLIPVNPLNVFAHKGQTIHIHISLLLQLSSHPHLRKATWSTSRSQNARQILEAAKVCLFDNNE